MTEGRYTADPNFVMPTAKEPPRDPATPPDKPPMGEDVWARRELNRAQDIRTTALGLAIDAYKSGGATSIFGVVDDFVAYITDGTKP